ncbi:hypothetical protein BDZ94DRAFT_986516 [Collybia nuda]|uniref:Uncharacterized protein n=1 Tax=Collybia nuda TaxID=64659 RepID=A0A9P5XXW9_9AGAR|nr:hypothetical protein BDZ94DRAFT_986516 [Collybia nuda]
MNTEYRMEDPYSMNFYPFEVPSNFPVELAMMVAIWVEVLLYGIYTCLFFSSLYIMLTKGKIQARSKKVILAAMILMYMVATFDIALNLYRLLHAFIWSPAHSGPRSYFVNVRRWDHVVNSLNYCIMVWLGDVLVLYRCFIVWDQSYVAIMVPTLFMLLSSATNAAIMFWFAHPPNVSMPLLIAWIDSIYVVNLVQNMLTTGLIVFKILRQHHLSSTAGARCIGSLRLTHIVRILIESALVYTIQLIILIVLHLRRHNAQFIVQYAIIPTIGIVFNLISVRTHMTEPWDAQTTRTDILADLPRWVDDQSSSATEPGETSSDRSIDGVPPNRAGQVGAFAQSESLGRRSACRRLVQS